jgi:Na+/H+-dicarboxylate symporter
MNGCAAFILTTVLFVSMSHGATYHVFEYILWIGIATLAAVGNAGVPMGCFFLSQALLIGMGVNPYLLSVILPFYTLIDMLETAINVWSDTCVTVVTDKEMALTAQASSISAISIIR